MYTKATAVCLIALFAFIVVASAQLDGIQNDIRDGMNRIRNGENHVLDAMNRAESDLKNMHLPRMPHIQTPHLQMPHIQMPNIQMPHIQMPSLSNEMRSIRNDIESMPGVRTAESK